MRTLVRLCHIYHKGPAGALALAVLLCAVLMNTVIPPMQSPDESSHLARAYLLSKGQVFLDQGPGGSGGYIDDGLLRYSDLFHNVGIGGKLDLELVNGIAPNFRWTGTESRRVYAGTGYYLPVIYLPQAMALVVGRELSLSVAHSYELARLAAFLCTAALIAVSVGLVKPSPLALGILGTPMVLFQAVSSTIDALSLGLCMLGVSCFLSLLRPQQGGSERWRFWVLCVSVFILASSRAHALPMVLLPFAVAWQKRNRSYLVASVCLLLCVLAWTAGVLLFVVDDRIPRTVSTAQILRYYALRPVQFFHVLIDTVEAKWGFYRESFIGTLGYLDVHLPALYERMAGVALVVLAMLSFRPIMTFAGEGRGRLLLAFTALISSFLIFVALLATWTPFPSSMIEGVQGRYFHIPALLLAYALAGIWTPEYRWIRIAAGALLTVFLVSSVYVTSVAVLERYWLSGRNYAEAATAGREPLLMGRDDTLSLRYPSPAGGRLYSVGVSLGTYYGKANGLLSLEVCATECAHGTVDVSQASDNLFAYFWLDRSLAVKHGVPMELEFSMSDSSTHPVVLWAYPDGNKMVPPKLNSEVATLAPKLLFAIQ